jgi:hypothetical protein
LVQKKTENLALIINGFPGVKFNSVTGAVSLYNLDSVANCASFHLALKEIVNGNTDLIPACAVINDASATKYPFAMIELSSLAGLSFI